MTIRYAFVWLLLALVSIGNGILREATYGKWVSELTAHQLSTMAGILLTGAVTWVVMLFWPIQSKSQAWGIGLLWFLQTVAFEFLFGRYVAGHSWERLLTDYNLFSGRLWLLFLLWLLVMPYLFHKLRADDSQ